MYTTQQWIARLAEETQLSYATVRQLQELFTHIVSERLARGLEVIIPFVGKLERTLCNTFIATVEEGTHYIMPPRVLLQLVAFPSGEWGEMGEYFAEETDLPSERIESFLHYFEQIARELIQTEKGVLWEGLGKLAPSSETPTGYTFTPDQLLYDAVNRPFAFYEPIPLSSEELFPQLQRIAFPSLEEAVATLPLVAHTPLRKESATPIVTKPSDELVTPPPLPYAKEKTLLQPELPPELPSRSAVLPPPLPSQQAPIASISMTSGEPPLSEADRKGLRAFRWVVVSLVVALCLGIGVYIFNRFSHRKDELDPQSQSTNSELVDQPLEKVAQAPEKPLEIVSPETASHEETVVAPDHEIATPSPLATITLSRGETLAAVARKYYGESCFWVYIYEENRAVLTNPHAVPDGVSLTIPHPTKYGIERTSETSLASAREKEKEILRTFPTR